MSTEQEFRPFPKIPRLNREVVITEKIDGSNACVIVSEDGDIFAQSRKRIITPEQDNFGFAQWVHDNAEVLIEGLGPGRHYGEWWGKGINRGYGVDEKYFSLFNVKRWLHLPSHVGFGDSPLSEAGPLPSINVRRVPIVTKARSLADSETIDNALSFLRETGSLAAPGFDNPEGIVLYHTQANSLFKVTLEHDERPKGSTE